MAGGCADTSFHYLTRLPVFLLNLPAARNSAASAVVNPLTQALQEIRFANNNGYLMYRWSCTNVQNNTTAGVAP